MVSQKLALTVSRCVNEVPSNSVIFSTLGEGGAARQHKTSLHAIGKVIREEGFFGVYNGYALDFVTKIIIVPVCVSCLY